MGVNFLTPAPPRLIRNFARRTLAAHAGIRGGVFL